MDWTSFPFNTSRLNNIVYEESYACEWDNNLKVSRVESMREKERTVNVSESNIYNITQEIAKQFSIFCRYKYIHDSNYHIIGRIVIFFNNFINDYNTLSLTYPYSSKKISRELDSTDLTTKLYVRSMDDSTTLLGQANISYSPANKIKEDYILNFDYLYESGAIDDSQKEWIQKYEKRIRDINSILIPLADTIANYENQKTEIEAKITTYTNSLAIDTEQINQNSALAQELISKYDDPTTNGQYINGYNSSHPAISMIIQDSNGNYYINLTAQKKGIQLTTLHIYRTYNASNRTLGSEITTYSIAYDDYGNPAKIYGIAPLNNNAQVYMTYEYDPQLYYNTIIETWKEKLYNDTQALERNKLLLENLDNNNEPQEPYGVKTLLAQSYELQEQYLVQKRQIMSEFEEIMGPALREGYWQPENYQDYGEYHSGQSVLESYNANTLLQDTADSFIIGWDDNLFDNEQKLYYESGVNQSRIVYPCINITSIYNQISNYFFYWYFIRY